MERLKKLLRRNKIKEINILEINRVSRKIDNSGTQKIYKKT